MMFFVLLSICASGAAAQDWSKPWSDSRDRPPRFDVSASAGVVLPTDWSDEVLLGAVSSASGVIEQVVTRDLRVKPGSVVGGAVTYWRGKYGFRTQVGRSRSSLLIGGDSAASIDVNTWFYDVRGAIGLVDYHPRRLAWPYVSLGFGGITYDLARTVSPPLLTFIEGGRPRSDPRTDIVIIDSGREFLLQVDELGTETVFAFNVGAGTDFRIPLGPAGLGLRVEVTDHIAPSPVDVHIQELSLSGVDSARPIRFDRVHHLRAAIGFVVQIGR